MKNILILFAFSLVFAACATTAEPDVPPIVETQESRVVAATEVAVEVEAVSTRRTDAIGSIAPDGTVFADVELDRGHDQAISYPFEGRPLMGGVHNPTWQRCGAYDAPVAMHFAIHTLEHGAVWISYNPDDVSESDVQRLESFTIGQPFVLVSPFPNQDHPIVVTAWGVQLAPESAQDGRIVQFVTAYANGPQSPEPGANCSSGNTSVVDG